MTRHNLGFLVVKALAHDLGMKFKEEARFHSYVAKGQVNEDNVYLLMPATYMNESGRAVKALVDYYKLGLKGLVVVSDDIAIDFGTMRLRSMGSAGGHNGLKSIEAHLATSHYARLRMGIGCGEGQPSLVEHVLDNFTRDELDRLPEFVQRGPRP